MTLKRKDLSWSTCFNKTKNFSNDFTSFGISAMEDRGESDVLFGRPYGGACILLNNRYVRCVKFVFCAERFAVLQLKSVVLVNLYMPCKTKRLTSSTLADISVEDVLDEVSSCLTTLDYEYLVIGGDFDVDLRSENASNRKVFDFVTDHDFIRLSISGYFWFELYFLFDVHA